MLNGFWVQDLVIDGAVKVLRDPQSAALKCGSSNAAPAEMRHLLCRCLFKVGSVNDVCE